MEKFVVSCTKCSGDVVVGDKHILKTFDTHKEALEYSEDFIKRYIQVMMAAKYSVTVDWELLTVRVVNSDHMRKLDIEKVVSTKCD